MKALLHTTIGPVLAEVRGHYIEIQTSVESFQTGLINLWDYRTDQLRMKPNLINVIREVSSTLRESFEDFRIAEIELLEADIEEILEPDAIERLKLMDNIEGSED